MQALIRSWNVFHGNTVPTTRRGYLREMIDLATDDRPAILCLQEVPVWALPHLAGWSGMQSYWLVARGPRRPAALAAAITRLRNGLFRSRLAGQANAIVVDRFFDTKQRALTWASTHPHFMMVRVQTAETKEAAN